jgi:DNA-directed RNA polymerase subunit RPC12/RpoP
VTWWLKALLTIVALGAALFLFGLGLMLKERRLPRRCPRCRWRALKNVGGARATKVDAQGRRYPAAWTDYKCGQCHAFLRLHVGGGWEQVSTVER